MKLLHLTHCFLSGAIGVTLLGWSLSFTTFFLKVACYGIALAILGILLGFILDDWLVNLLDISHAALYGTLLSSGAAISLRHKNAVGCIVLVGYLQ